MKLRNPKLIRAVAFFCYCLIRCWMRTTRPIFDYTLSGKQPGDPAHSPRIFLFWHEYILWGTIIRSKVQVLISQHQDGELIARICDYLKFDTVRGSSRRGGAKAMLDLIRKKGYNYLLTPDGPRGPRRQLQPGVVFLASKLGLPVILIGIGYRHLWRAKSWDRFAIPRPFSQMFAVFSKPIFVPPKLSAEGLEYYRQLIELRLLEATHEAERRANGLPAQPLPLADLPMPEHLRETARTKTTAQSA